MVFSQTYHAWWCWALIGQTTVKKDSLYDNITFLRKKKMNILFLLQSEVSLETLKIQKTAQKKTTIHRRSLKLVCSLGTETFQLVSCYL